MLEDRDRSLLAVVSAGLVPWDVFLFNGGLGWGVTVLFVRIVDTRFGTRLTPATELVGLYHRLGPPGETGLVIAVAWGVAAAVASAGILVALTDHVWNEGPAGTDRYVGAALVLAGSLFVLSRVVGNGLLVWNSLPVGALYAAAVGAVLFAGGVGPAVASIDPRRSR